MAAIKKSPFILLLAVFLAPASAEWSRELDLSLGANHSSRRIHADGEIYEKNHLGLEFRLNGELDADDDSQSWKNTLKADYSGSKTKDETDPWNSPRWTETSDELKLDSVYSRKTGFFAHPYFSLNAQTPFYDAGFDGEWLALHPLQLRESAGFIIPIYGERKKELSLRAGYFHQHYLKAADREHDPSHGVELVAEFDGRLGEKIEFISKAGLYRGVVETDDSWSAGTSSDKSVFEWDNLVKITLGRFFTLNIAYNLDNKDVRNSEIAYETDHRTTIALNWKIF